MKLSCSLLHCLSNFSFLRCASHAEHLVARAAELGYTAMAITDECSVSGVVRAHTEARGQPIKLIIGAEFAVHDAPAIDRLILLAKSRNGYGDLSELITLARSRSPKGEYQLFADDLAHITDCIAILVTHPLQSDVRTNIDAIAKHFPGHCWLGAALDYGPDDAGQLAALEALAAACRLPLTACDRILFACREDKPLQDVLTAVRLKQPVAELGTALNAHAENYLKPIAHLARRYSAAMITQTLVIAAQCKFSLDELRYEYPREVIPVDETPAAYLRRLTDECGARRYPQGMPDKVRAIVEHELAIISDLHYEAYFLTIYDLVRFAREKHILCQGRGSAANSAVCYCLGITEVDPEHMQVLFERFISRERNEPPDIDVDFEHERREEVMQYLYTKYGRDRTALTAAVSTYRPKGAIRDVGKALGLTLSQVDALSKTIAWWDGRSIAPERLIEAGFDPEAPRMRTLMKLTEALIGFPRHLSQHSGGFVIARDKLTRLVPIENAAMPERTVIQWDKDDLDALGLLKVDVLALGMLTAIRKTLDLIGQWSGQPMTMQDVPREDPATYEMIQHADTLGVFQIESRAQMSMLPRLKPKCFYDLVIEVAIVRPGPIQGGMVHPYLKRRTGEEPVIYPSKAVEAVLSRTLGVPIFQEQVMQLAMVAAGFTAGEADQLRRAMAAWKRKGGLEKFRDKLVGGMRERGYDEEFAERLYKQMQGFGEYGFPESHAASFALLVYISCWLKCHHPAAFTCGMLNSQPLGFYSPSQLVQDVQRHGVTVLPVDVMVSDFDCTLEHSPLVGQSADSTFFSHVVPAKGETGNSWPMGHARRTGKPCRAFRGSEAGTQSIVSLVNDGLDSSIRWNDDISCSCIIRTGSEENRSQTKSNPRLRLGLRMVAQLGKDAAERIVSARTQSPFLDIADLQRRAALSQQDIEALAAADAFRTLIGHRRDSLWEALGLERDTRLFTAPADPTIASLIPPSEADDIVADYRSLGLSLRRHPLALLRPALTAQRIRSAEEVKNARHGQLLRTTGLVTCRQRPGTAKGTTFVTLEDETGYVNVVVWSHVAARQRNPLILARLLCVAGRVERQGEVVHLIAGRLIDQTAMLGELDFRSHEFH
ncbi:MAG: error-prone DNA polymerase [Betaproteobacteria bacterium]